MDRHLDNAFGKCTVCGAGIVIKMKAWCSGKPISKSTLCLDLRFSTFRCSVDEKPSNVLLWYCISQVDWYTDLYYPFLLKWTECVHTASTRHKLIFVEPIPNEVCLDKNLDRRTIHSPLYLKFCPATWTPDWQPANMVFAPHWFVAILDDDRILTPWSGMTSMPCSLRHSETSRSMCKDCPE